MINIGGLGVVCGILVGGAATYFIYSTKAQKDIMEDYYDAYQDIARSRVDLVTKLYDSKIDDEEIKKIEKLLPFPEPPEFE